MAKQSKDEDFVTALIYTSVRLWDPQCEGAL